MALLLSHPDRLIGEAAGWPGPEPVSVFLDQHQLQLALSLSLSLTPHPHPSLLLSFVIKLQRGIMLRSGTSFLTHGRVMSLFSSVCVFVRVNVCVNVNACTLWKEVHKMSSCVCKSWSDSVGSGRKLMKVIKT